MRVMSYNLRVDTPKDGKLSWEHRIPAVKWVWKELDADIVGIQEGLPHQVEGLDQWFPQYARVGIGRNADGGGECVAIYFKRDTWTCLEHGDFWLSDTPDVPGSRSWGNNIPRISTWAVLEHQNGQRWFVLNTHLDHQSEEARVKGAELIRRFLDERANDHPVVVTGDFNAGLSSGAITTLVGDGYLVDVLACAHATEGTFHGYTGEPRSRIDYILASPAVQVNAAKVVRDQPLDLWPSDHFPICADLE